MKKKFTAMLALLSAAVITVTACGKPAETTPDTASGTALGSLDDATVIAKLSDETKTDKPEDFRITLGDFNKEYKFRLLYTDTDETDAANADTCADFRSSIIEYLTLEKISFYEAAKLGITGETLSDEDKATVSSNAESTVASYKTSYEEEAKALLGDTYSENDLDAKETELLNNFLAECGYTTDIFSDWARIELIQTRLFEKLIENENITVSAEEVDEFYTNAQTEAKALYETNVASFESSTGYSAIYVPEGSRNIRHIYLPFDTTAAAEITAKRAEGDNTAADALRDTAYQAVGGTAAVILDMLNQGGDFSEIQTVYNQDPNGKYDYMLIPGTTVWAEAYSTAAFAMEKVGDHSGIVTTDDGVYILNYYSDAELSEDTVTALKGYAESSLLQQKQNNFANGVIDEWKAEYVFDIDKAALNIAEETAAAETTAAEVTPAA